MSQEFGPHGPLLEICGELSVQELRQLTPRQLKDIEVARLIVSEHGFGSVPVAVVVPYDDYLEFKSRLNKAKEVAEQFSRLLDRDTILYMEENT